MPTYLFEDTNTGEEIEISMKISERDPYLEANPHMRQLVNGFPADVDSYRIGRTKPSDGFKDLLTHIKKNNQGSKIRTFK
jgi:hypothetical protein